MPNPIPPLTQLYRNYLLDDFSGFLARENFSERTSMLYRRHVAQRLVQMETVHDSKGLQASVEKLAPTTLMLVQSAWRAFTRCMHHRGHALPVALVLPRELERRVPNGANREKLAKYDVSLLRMLREYSHTLDSPTLQELLKYSNRPHYHNGALWLERTDRNITGLRDVPEADRPLMEKIFSYLQNKPDGPPPPGPFCTAPWRELRPLLYLLDEPETPRDLPPAPLQA